MAKRQREDYESPPADSASPGGPGHTEGSVSFPSLAEEEAVSSKLVHLDSEFGSGEAPPPTAMQCSLPPHRQTLPFGSYEEYEVHYNKVHVNRCLECRKNFPTEHFLNLHIEENHDALVSVKKERGDKTYACFVEDCDKLCSTPQKRRMHLIDKHMFPKEYDFYIVNDGVDHRSSMLRSGRYRRHSSAAQHTADIEDRARRRNSTRLSSQQINNNKAMEAENVGEDKAMTSPSSLEDEDMEDLSGAMSALKFVPPSVRFGRGRGKGRGGFSRT